MTPIITVSDAVILALVMSRIVALLMAFPFFNTPMLPLNVKVLLVIALSFYSMKIANLHIDLATIDFYVLVLLVLKELLTGFILGLLTNIFISAFSFAAELVSYFMGITVVNSFDPTYGQVSVLSRFFIMLFMLLFFVTGAYRYFFSTIISSFDHIPIDRLTFHQGVWEYIIELSKELFTFSFKLAFPFALILYVINVSLALVNRLIPQINVFIVGLPLQIFVGLASLSLGATVLIYSGEKILLQLSKHYSTLLRFMG